MARDTAGNPGGDGARGPRRTSDRRRPHATGPQATGPPVTGPPVTGEHTGEEPWATELTGPQQVFPVWDGVPGFEFEGGRASRRPADHHGTGPRAVHGRRPGTQGQQRRFRYTPTVNQPTSARPQAPQAWSRDELAAPGFEFDSPAQAVAPLARGTQPGSPDPRAPDPRTPDRRAPDPRAPQRHAPELRGARTEWVRLLRSFVPEPVKRNWFREFRSALHFRGAGTRVIIPIVAMMVFGVAVVVIAGANGSQSSQNGPTLPPSALGFPPATLAGNAFTAATGGRGISQTLGQVTSDGTEIVAVGLQQGARIARAQFFVSTDDGRSWFIGHVRTQDGGPPPPGFAARFVAGGHGAWVALGPRSIWTSPDGQTWTLSSTVGLPLRSGDQISALERTAAGFIAVGSNVPDGTAAGATPVVFLSANGIGWQRLGARQLQLPAGTGRVLGLRYAAVSGNRILIAGNVALTQNAGRPRHPVTTQTSAAWLSGNGGTTWTLAVPPGPAGLDQTGAGSGARAEISGAAVTADGFILARPAAVAGKPAVDIYRSPNGTTWTFAATLDTRAGFVAGQVNGATGGAVVSGQDQGSSPALVAFTSADGASWRRTPAFGSAEARNVSGVTATQDGTVVTAGTTTDDPDSRQPLLTVIKARGPAKNVDIANIPGAIDPQLAVNDVAAGNGMQVAVGSANGYPAVWASANGGTTWTRATGQTPGVLDRPGIQQLTSVTGGADGWLAVGGIIAVAPEHPVVLASGNATVWTAADRQAVFSLPGLVTEQAAAAPAGGYVIVGYQAVAGRTIAAAWWSANLTGWQRAGDAVPGALDGPGASRQMLAVTAGPQGLVAVGADGNAAAAWTSPNGQAWTQQHVPLPSGATRAVLQHVASNGRTVVAVGAVLTTAGQRLPFAASSADGGHTWTQSALPVPAGRASVTALTGTGTGAGRGFLATGTFGRTPGHQDVVVWTSADGSTWTAATPAGQGLTGRGIQVITGLDVSDSTLTGVGFIALPAGEQPIFWQSPVR